MADALVSAVVMQLVSIIRERVEQEVKLVRGVEQQLTKLQSNFEAIRGVLEDAEKRQVEDRSVRDWLLKLKDAAYDADDLLDRWNTLFHIHQQDPYLVLEKKKKGCSFISFPCSSVNQLTLRRDIAIHINDLNEKLDNIATQKERYQFISRRPNATPNNRETVALVDWPTVKGRDKDKETILEQLFCGSSDQGYGVSVVAIVGVGGIGKTTLAQLCCTDEAVKTHFGKIMWVCCEPFDKVKVAKAMVEGFTGKLPEADTLNVLLIRIQELASREKFLLVLDDVWPNDVKNWEPFKAAFLSCVRGSKVLVTTRSIDVVQQMESSYKHFIDKLSAQDSWELFSNISLLRKKQNKSYELIEIGQKIVKKCDGLPLAVKSIGSLLGYKDRVEDWRNILESEVWESKVVIGILCPPLLLSYHDLGYKIKQCFLYCAVFQKDETIYRDELIQLWMAQGYLGTKENMERRGREYFEELASRSFFQDFEKDSENNIVKCKMHDMVHDFVQFLAKDEFLTLEMGGEVEDSVVKSESSSCKPRHLTLITPGETTESGNYVPTIKDGENLHTVFINGGTDVLWDWFDHLTCVRALKLIDFSLRFPLNLEKLIHLRYLEISGDDYLSELSDSVCDLYNLQTLKIIWCLRFEKLPTRQKMGKLTKLRHLEMEGGRLGVFPKGIEMLRSDLQTLNLFIVGNIRKHENDEEAKEDEEYCNIGALGKWEQLHGILEIRGLGNVRERGQAERAKLRNKIHLHHLVLDFNIPKWQKSKRVMDDGEILEALHQPPPHLEVMQISNYTNTNPSFLNNFLMSCFLPNLKELHLKSLIGADCLPHALSRLPSLESLVIATTGSLKKVGDEFMCLSPSSSSSPGVDFPIAFPKLDYLVFSFMPNWEEWESSTITCHSRKDVTAATTITIMPSLSHLELIECPKLKALPQFLVNVPLKELHVKRCHELEKRLTKETGEEWPIISRIPKVTVEGKDVNYSW